VRLHRFYTGNHLELKHDFWTQDIRLINQWSKVLRYQAGQEIVLFDGIKHDRLYKIVEINDREAHLQHITDFERKTPKREIYLFFSLLKKDKNDWVLQKCTELGVSHFVPLLAERSEKTGFDSERASKILVEAAEQCGRSDIPSVREPLLVQTVLNEFKNKMQLLICEKSDDLEIDDWKFITGQPVGLLVGPEGGWSAAEKELFKNKKLPHLNLHDFTLRAETACVAAVTKLVQ
jgi:16S rRNA (uracil1498-N3)-methyltransferase